MKVAITTKGPNLGCQVDPRFGRAEHLLVVDTQTGICQTHDNSANAQSPSGSGVRAGERIVNLGVQVLITGHVGPKALRVCQASGIEVFVVQAGTAQDALRAWEASELKSLTDSTA